MDENFREMKWILKTVCEQVSLSLYITSWNFQVFVYIYLPDQTVLGKRLCRIRFAYLYFILLFIICFFIYRFYASNLSFYFFFGWCSWKKSICSKYLGYLAYFYFSWALSNVSFKAVFLRYFISNLHCFHYNWIC